MKKDFNIASVKYKKFLVPVTLNLLAVFLIFWVIIPQVSKIPEGFSKISAEESRIEVLNKSLSVVNSLSSEDVDSKFATSVGALPTVKDAAQIFSALSSAAAASNTQITSFSLNIGGIFGRVADLNQGGSASPSIEVSADISGSDARDLALFASEIKRRLPLAEIRSLSINNNSAHYEIGYFYKPLDTTKIEAQEKIAPLNQSEENLLNQLEEWKQ